MAVILLTVREWRSLYAKLKKRKKFKSWPRTHMQQNQGHWHPGGADQRPPAKKRQREKQQSGRSSVAGSAGEGNAEGSMEEIP
jgi:hypothetical protein